MQVKPVSLEWQRNWVRCDTYDALMAIVREHSVAYGMSVNYAYIIVHKASEREIHLPMIAPEPVS